MRLVCKLTCLNKVVVVVKLLPVVKLLLLIARTVSTPYNGHLKCLFSLHFFDSKIFVTVTSNSAQFAHYA